jgi:ABC-type branched-subunit amino acid transport system substrate-binding protein
MRLRTVIPAAAAIGALLAASACGNSGSGSSSSEKGINGKVVTVGLSETLSGPGADFGNIGRGAQAYLENVNAEGGINGYTFKFTAQDNAYVSSTAVATARALAPKSFMIVTGGTPPVQGIKTVADALKTPIFANANGDFFANASKYMFGQNPSYAGLAMSDTRFLVQDKGFKKLALLYQSDDVGEGASKAVPGYAKSLGATVLTSVGVPITATDFSAYAAKLKSSGADAVVSMMAPAILAGVQKAAISVQYNPKWTSIFATQSTSYTQSVPASVVANTYSDAYQHSVNADPSGATFKKVVGKYFPEAVTSSSAVQGWNFGAIIEKAVKSATAGGKALTQADFMKALESDFSGSPVGFIPSLTYTAANHVGASAAAVYTLTPDGPGQMVSDFKPIPSKP